MYFIDKKMLASKLAKLHCSFKESMISEIDGFRTHIECVFHLKIQFDILQKECCLADSTRSNKSCHPIRPRNLMIHIS